MTQSLEQAQAFTDQLRERGFIDLPLAIDESTTQAHFANFAALAAEANEPDGSGRHLIHASHYGIPGRPDDADFYITRQIAGKVNPFSRDGKGAPSTDNKDTAHFGARSVEHAESFYRNLGGMPVVLANYLETATEIYDATRQASRLVFDALGVTPLMLPENERDDVIMLRSLIYRPTQETHQADLHIDRSAMTVAIKETRPGLVGAPGDNLYSNPDMTLNDFEALVAKVNNSPITHKAGFGKFFLAAGSRHLPAPYHEAISDLPMLPHGVQNLSPNEERGAIVMFFNPRNGHQANDYQVPEKYETGFEHLETRLKEKQANS